MADEPNSQQTTNDDAELAKVLAGITQDSPVVADDQTAAATEEPLPEISPLPQAPALSQVAEPANPQQPQEVATPAPTLSSTDSPAHTAHASSGELDSIKLEALSELRPLVDKLNVSAEEKFDTYLLLLRSTDDKALIAPAHDAAKSITDEARRAQALLDIIKEIDFLSQSQPPAK